MKKHYKRHASSLYYSRRVESGGAWKMMKLVGHTFLKKLTLVIRFSDTSLLHVELGLIGRFPTDYLFHKSLILNSPIID
jgi:hypothetical protein